jgi:hypothetical protein
MSNNTISFLRGYGSVLSLRSMRRHSTRRYMFRGNDLSKISAADALRQDWCMVGSSITSALTEAGEQEDERREVEQPTR